MNTDREWKSTAASYLQLSRNGFLELFDRLSLVDDRLAVSDFKLWLSLDVFRWQLPNIVLSSFSNQTASSIDCFSWLFNCISSKLFLNSSSNSSALPFSGGLDSPFSQLVEFSSWRRNAFTCFMVGRSDGSYRQQCSRRSLYRLGGHRSGNGNRSPFSILCITTLFFVPSNGFLP